MAEWIEERIAGYVLTDGFTGTTTVRAIAAQMADINNRFGSKYNNLCFKSVQDCGHPFHCECAPAFVLYGTRRVDQPAELV